MANAMAGAGVFQNPALFGSPCGCGTPGGGGESAAFSLALAITINSEQPQQAQAQAEGGKAGKHGKNGKNGKAGKHGKHGKNGKNGKNGKDEGQLSNPLHNNASMALAMAMAGSGTNGCSPMGSMCGPQGQNAQQQMLTGLMVGLMLANSQNNACMGANPGMGGFLNQFGRCGF